MDAIGAFDLTKTYSGKGGEVTALKSVNLQVPEGRIMACVGPEASGKTTLIRLLSGLLRPTAGECSVLGLSPGYETARLHSMLGTVLYSAKLYADLTLWENLLFFAGVHGVRGEEAIERASFLMHRLDLWDQRDRLPGALPTGMFKRASLARALMHRPRVLLMDSQGAGMDLETAGLVRELLGYVRAQEGMSALLCTQDMGFAESVAGSFGLLSKGTLMARGDLESLRIGGGVRLRASLRLKDGDEPPQGFARQKDGCWQREIENEEDMPRLVMQAVSAGSSLYEARVLRPSLWDIYRAYESVGRRREAALNERAGDETAKTQQKGS